MVCVGLFRKRPNLGGTLEGPDLQQGELPMVCVGLFRKRPNLGGTLEGPDLQQGELSMVCVGLQCSGMTSREKFWGARQNFGGEVAPLAPPLFVHSQTNIISQEAQRKRGTLDSQERSLMKRKLQLWTKAPTVIASRGTPPRNPTTASHKDDESHEKREDWWL